jgi:uncharacterized protein (TIGR03437 family)
LNTGKIDCTAALAASAPCYLTGFGRFPRAVSEDSVTKHVLGIALSVAAPLVAQVTFSNTPSREFGQTTLVLPGPTSNAPNLIEGREFNYPSGIAFDYSVSPPAVYVADTLNNRVLGWRNSAAVATGSTADIVIGQLNFASNLVGGPGTGQSTGLLGPAAVAVDSKGNLYVADAGNNRILRYPTPFQQTSPIVTVDLVIGQQSVSSGTYPNAGNSKPSNQTVYFSYSNHLSQSGLAFDSSGNLWTTDPLNNRALRFPAANLAAGTVQPAADMVLGQCDFVSSQGPQAPNNLQTNMNALVAPSGLAFDTAGRLYIADAYSRVLEFQPPAANCQAADRVLGIAVQNQQSQQPYPTQYTLGTAGACGPACSPQGVFTLGNYLYVCDTPENRVVGYDIYSNWPAPTTTIPSPPEISEIGQPGFNGQPNLTSGQTNANQYQPSSSSLYSPLAGAVNNVTNEIWIVDTSNNRVLVFPAPAYTSASRVLGQLDFPYNAPNLIDGEEVFFGQAGGIVVDKTSTPPHLYIADPGNNRVLGFMNASSVGTDSHSILTQKADLVIGQPNLMSSQANYSPSNTQLSQAQIPNSTGLSVPTGLAVDSNGNLYVADSGNGRVLRFPQPFSQPSGSLQTANLVLGQSSFTTKIQDPSQSTMNTPYGLALFNGPTGVSNAGGLAVSDLVHNRILIFNKPAGGDFTSGQAASIVLGQQNFTSTSIPATATTASLNAPRHIASDTSDFLYVADTGNNRLLVFANASKSVNGANAALQVPGLNQPEGVAVSLITGDIWVANTNQSQLVEFPAFQTLLANNQSIATLTNVLGPLALALDASDNLVVADGTNRVTFFFPAMFYRNAANYTSGILGGNCTTSTNLTPGMLALLGRYGQSAQDVFSFTAAPTQPLPWPTKGLNGVQVLVDGVAAPVFGLGTTAVYFQVPYETPSSGTADFVVQNPSTGQILAAANFNLQAAAPGIFTVNQSGTGQAAATLADGSVNSASNQVARGSTITLWLTGSGYIPNIMDGVAPGAAISTPTPPQVFFNAIQATNIEYSGVSPQYPGLWQINVTVPSNVPPGNNVPVLVLGSTSDYASNCGGSSANVGPGPDQVLNPQPTIAVK